MLITRPENRIHHNFERNNQLFLEYCKKNGLTETELRDKTRRFKTLFDKELFTQVTHGIGTYDEKPQVTLMSTARLAEDEGKKPEEVSTRSGPQDEAIGNTNLVFANLYPLSSRSMAGVLYKIDSRDGWVVPVDYADLKAIPDEEKLKSLPPGYFDAREYFEDKITLYADNIYRIPDFEQFFSGFSAAFFESPEVAIRTLAEAGRDEVARGNYWMKYSVNYRSKTLPDPTALIRIRDFFEETGVVPPMVPEYQFKDSVPATLLGFSRDVKMYPGFKVERTQPPPLV